MTDMLSPYMYVGPVSGTPIMRSLYLMPLSASTPVFIATNSAPKTEPSMVACFLLNQSISAVFKNMKYPVRYRLVILSLAWSLSTHIRRSTDFPLGSGALGGMALVTSPYNVFHSAPSLKVSKSMSG